MVNQEKVIASTQRWLMDTVIGHNFCPFAKPVLDNIHYQVLSADPQQRLEELADSLCQLAAEDAIETALLIIPKGLEDFYDYLDHLGMAEALLSQQGFDGEFQLASFHPDYCFGGVDPKAAENYTNRSPYPIWHVLREDSLSKVLDGLTSPEKLPERNRSVAERLGADVLAQSLRRSLELG